MSVPSIRHDPRGWFRYYDRDGSGKLDRREVIGAFVATFGACEPGVLSSIVEQLWPLFDRDGNGYITEQEFVAQEGLCETMLAQMPEEEFGAPQSGAGLSPDPAGGAAVTLHCWQCRNQSTVTAPAGMRFIMYTYVYFRTQYFMLLL